MVRRLLVPFSALLMLLADGIVPASASAETTWSPTGVVVDWNTTMIAALEAAKTPPPPSIRIGAIVQAAVFDAVNGVTRRYSPYHVTGTPRPGTSAFAAAAGAAHEALVRLLPAQQAMFDAQLAASLPQLAGGSNPAIARGLAWGTSGAAETLAWRAPDGFTATLPPYAAVPEPGRYQLTAPGSVAPAFRQF